MPSSPVHLKLAYIMADELKVTNLPDFLLGSVSPDCVNYGMEQAGEKERYTAHIRSRDYDIWKQQLRDFYRENKAAYEGSLDFLRGYLFHCWCDIAWDEAVQPKIFEFLGALGYGYDDMTEQKWFELYRFSSEITKDPDYSRICRLLLKGEPKAIAGCSAELVKKFGVYVAEDYRDKLLDEKPLFLNPSHIQATAEQMRRAGYTDELMK